MRALLILALLLCGCQASKKDGPYGYRFENVPSNSLDVEIEFYVKRLKQRPKSFLERNNLAQAYLSKAQQGGEPSFYGLAEKLAQESLAIQGPGNTAAKLILASVAEARHDFQRSLELTRQVYELDPTDADARSLMSNSLMEMGAVQEAYNLAVGQRLPSPAALMQLARLQILRGEDDKARKALEYAIKTEQPQERRLSARLRSLLAEIDYRHGNLSESRRLFELSARILKNNPPALQGLAKIALREKNPQQAEQYLTEAFSYNQDPGVLIDLARLKPESEADHLRQKAASLLTPEIQQGRYGHARDLARLRLDEGKPEEALKLLEQEEKQRKDWKLYELKARALEQLKEPAKADESLQKAMASGLQDPALFLRAARLQRALGNQAKAADWEKSARELDPGLTEEFLDL